MKTHWYYFSNIDKTKAIKIRFNGENNKINRVTSEYVIEVEKTFIVEFPSQPYLNVLRQQFDNNHSYDKVWKDSRPKEWVESSKGYIRFKLIESYFREYATPYLSVDKEKPLKITKQEYENIEFLSEL